MKAYFILILFLLTHYLSFSTHAFQHDTDSYSSNCNMSNEVRATHQVYEDVIDNSIETSMHELLNHLSIESEILIIGETHTEAIAKHTLLENLVLLQKNNYKSLAIEMQNQSQQNSLNQFCKGQMNRDDFENIWSSSWSYHQQTNNYLDVIEKACDLGFKVFAVDTRDQPNNSMDLRNESMAANILQIHNNDPNSKIVFLTGSLHALTEPLDLVDDTTKEFVGNTSVKIELKTAMPKLRIASINITNTFPMINIPIYCPYKNRTKEFRRLVPESDFLLFKGTREIQLDYVYLKFKN